MRQKFLAAVAAVFALLALTAPANAATLDPAIGETLTFEENNTGAPIITNFGIPSATNTVYHFGGSASASVSQGGTMLSAQATEGRVDGFGDGLPTQGQANLTYSFEVVGPSSANSVLVPLNLQANLSGSGNVGEAILNLQYSNQINPSLIFNAEACGIPPCQNQITVNQQLSVTPNQPIKVQEQVNALTDGTFTAQAIADPFIQIDAGFLATNPGFSLEFSDGIVNAPISSAPLPPALPMFGAALLALGAFGWRKSRLAKVA